MGFQPEQYLAGLWRDHLAFGLTWAVSGSRQPRPAYRAPSWSWASVDGEMVHKGASSGAELALEVLDAYTEYVSAANPFSAVKGGYLVVKSRVKMASCLIDQQGIRFYNEYNLKGSLDTTTEPNATRFAKETNGRKVWLLHCQTHFDYRDEAYSVVKDYWSVGLVLFENPVTESFVRIGSFRYEGKCQDWEIRTIKII